LLVYEYTQKVILKKDIEYSYLATNISHFIDKTLTEGENKKFAEFHTERGVKFYNQKGYKFYTFDYLYPNENDKIYKKDKIYKFRIRTLLPELVEYLIDNLGYLECENLVGVGGEIKILPKKMITDVYSLTPVIFKFKGKGYWKNNDSSLDVYEELLKKNTLNKYNAFNETDVKIKQFYDGIELKNQKPIKFIYKNITLLGDKIQIKTSKDKISQDMWYFLLGAGIGEMNSRGAGFIDYHSI